MFKFLRQTQVMLILSNTQVVEVAVSYSWTNSKVDVRAEYDGHDAACVMARATIGARRFWVKYFRLTELLIGETTRYLIPGICLGCTRLFSHTYVWTRATMMEVARFGQSICD